MRCYNIATQHLFFNGLRFVNLGLIKKSKVTLTPSCISIGAGSSSTIVTSLPSYGENRHPVKPTERGFYTGAPLDILSSMNIPEVHEKINPVRI